MSGLTEPIVASHGRNRPMRSRSSDASAVEQQMQRLDLRAAERRRRRRVAGDRRRALANLLVGDARVGDELHRAHEQPRQRARSAFAWRARPPRRAATRARTRAQNFSAALAAFASERQTPNMIAQLSSERNASRRRTTCVTVRRVEDQLDGARRNRAARRLKEQRSEVHDRCRSRCARWRRRVRALRTSANVSARPSCERHPRRPPEHRHAPCRRSRNDCLLLAGRASARTRSAPSRPRRREQRRARSSDRRRDAGADVERAVVETLGVRAASPSRRGRSPRPRRSRARSRASAVRRRRP